MVRLLLLYFNVFVVLKYRPKQIRTFQRSVTTQRQVSQYGERLQAGRPEEGEAHDLT
jgi:hypothetical protein